MPSKPKTAEAYRARVKAHGGLSDAQWALQHPGETDGSAEPAAPLQLVSSSEPHPSRLRRIADIIRGHEAPQPDPVLSFGLGMDDGTTAEPQPLWPRNPVPAGDTKRPRTLRGRPAGADDLTPLFAGGLVILVSFSLGEWAAPDAEESDAIAVPLANIVARRIDLAAKLGRDASDTIALLVALMVYSYRVVPLGVERARTGLEQRRQRTIVEPEYSRPTGPVYTQGQDSMAAGNDGTEGPTHAPAYNPHDALARVRATGLSILSRDLGGAQGASPTLDDRQH